MTDLTQAFASLPVMVLLRDGGWTMWLIAVLALATLAVILWRIVALWGMGAWGGVHSARALESWRQGQPRAALAEVSGRPSVRARVAYAAMATQIDGRFDDEGAREETQRVARMALSRSRGGLRALELIATIAPLLGLLGTVLGMIAAFQVLQQSGSRADPTALAGGIWEALLTTAAGMAVAIPASVALSWFESVSDRLQTDLEDLATRIFIAAPQPGAMQRLRAAE
ncbi:MotA/TolQ/ExbB proton channel family protein [Paracoccus tegillarcae]|uniref:Flagellar motor protein MotA n=1 Tax=Paracoccus tegillarcae TaxID=1529068 RepID=A0A2K9EQ09_9RHOB|nr:MotA/TolQ/ExbB proton channel family protein [Paracoccus tegillarcae]AUH32816.1 flagellar motor protein MotA [Paracoccus tegillarcae]